MILLLFILFCFVYPFYLNPFICLQRMDQILAGVQYLLANTFQVPYFLGRSQNVTFVTPELGQCYYPFFFSQLKCALNLHLICIKKNANRALDAFFMLWSECCLLNLSKIAPLEVAVSVYFFQTLMPNCTKINADFATLQKMYANLVPKRCQH